MPIYYHIYPGAQYVPYVEEENELNDEQNIPFYHECYNFRQDLTTVQKMIVFKFIMAIENATEVKWT